MVKQLTTESDFKEFIADGVVIIDFFATWCGPCKQISPFIEQLEPKYPNVKFAKVDVEELGEASREYEVTAMPTFLFLKDGKVIGKVIGANPRGIQDALAKL